MLMNDSFVQLTFSILNKAIEHAAIDMIKDHILNIALLAIFFLRFTYMLHNIRIIIVINIIIIVIYVCSFIMSYNFKIRL